MGIAGHVSRKMLERYSHARQALKRAAVDRLGKSGQSTVGSQSDQFQLRLDSQVIEKNGGREGIRTPGLLVANEALSQLSYSPMSSREILTEANGLANQVAAIVT